MLVLRNAVFAFLKTSMLTKIWKCVCPMAFAELKKLKAVTARKRGARAAAREVLEAKPKKLTPEEFEQLCLSVARRIPKTLAILAK